MKHICMPGDQTITPSGLKYSLHFGSHKKSSQGKLKKPTQAPLVYISLFHSQILPQSKCDHFVIQ